MLVSPTIFFSAADWGKVFQLTTDLQAIALSATLPIRPTVSIFWSARLSAPTATTSSASYTPASDPIISGTGRTHLERHST